MLEATLDERCKTFKKVVQSYLFGRSCPFKLNRLIPTQLLHPNLEKFLFTSAT
jgi:hypothetical protein